MKNINVQNQSVVVPSHITGIHRTYFLFFYKEFVCAGTDPNEAAGLAELRSNLKMISVAKTKSIVAKSGFTY
jgi:hypothetical protein